MFCGSIAESLPRQVPHLLQYSYGFNVLNVNLRVKLVITLIFTDIQRVRTWLFDKSNGVCFV